MQKTYKIIGMHCAGCAMRLESAVKQQSDFQNVGVNILTNSLTLDFDESALSPAQADEKVVHIVEKTGFQVELETPKQTDNQSTTQTTPFPTTADESKSSGRSQLRSIENIYPETISILFLLALMVVSMGAMLGIPMPSALTDVRTLGVTELMLLIPIVIVHRGFFVKGLGSLWRGSPNMDALVAVGSGASIAYSLYVLSVAFIKGGTEPSSAHFYFESAAMILVIVSVGRMLEGKAKQQTTSAIESLLNLTPLQAHVRRNGQVTDVSVNDVTVGETVLVYPRETIPVDGVVLKGESDVDCSILTGEPLPISCQPGDEVSAGTINQSGELEIQAVRVGRDSTVSQIAKMVEQAAAGKARLARLADSVCSVFVPTVMSLSAVTFLYWLIVGKGFEFAMTCAVSTLVISCPCALGLATPTAIMVGLGVAAKRGILFKSAGALESLQKIRTVVFDKTGTITQGVPTFEQIFPMNDISEEDILSVAFSLELESAEQESDSMLQNSTSQNRTSQKLGFSTLLRNDKFLHPLATAIVHEAERRGLNKVKVTDVHVYPGKGVVGIVNGSRWSVGSQRLMNEMNVELLPETEQQFQRCIDNGTRPIFIGKDSNVAGIITVCDTLKPDTVQAIDRLKRDGKRVVLLTGDNSHSAERIAQQAGIETVIADVLPGQKADAIADLQKSDGLVAMVGDGINDAVALTASDCGLALGTGANIAVESADVVLQRPDVSCVPDAMRISHAVVTNIKQNLFWAFFYNIIGIPVAMGLFASSFGWTLSPIFAAGAMSLSSLCVVLNALRLKRWRVDD